MTKLEQDQAHSIVSFLDLIDKKYLIKNPDNYPNIKRFVKTASRIGSVIGCAENVLGNYKEQQKDE